MVDANGLYIIIVCTFGAGSSQLLKMNIDESLRELGVENIITSVCDSGSYRGEKCDGIITLKSHFDMVQHHPTAKAYASIEGIFNKQDIKEKVKQLMVDLGVID